MKKLKTLAMCMLAAASLTACSNAKTQDNTVNQNDMKQNKILVAYFSATGTTEAVAKEIASATEGTLYEIEPDVRYTDADLDWRNKQSRSSVEMQDDSCRPALGGEKVNMEEYDVVFIGFPNWWNLPPRQINSFIESYDLKGKKLVLFSTSGGSTIDNSLESLKKLYPDLEWADAKLLNDTTGLASWAKGLVK